VLFLVHIYLFFVAAEQRLTEPSLGAFLLRNSYMLNLLGRGFLLRGCGELRLRYALRGPFDAVAFQESIDGGLFSTESLVEFHGVLSAATAEDAVAEYLLRAWMQKGEMS